MAMTGIHAFLELLAGAGVNTLFGNPGTTELPLSDALVDHPRIRYILGLQEVPVMAMADGYAMASRGLGVVNLHISCGLGNAMGMLYNAYREGTPLLVTAGQQDRRLKFAEPILWGDMVSVVRPWTKWAVEVDRVEDLPAAVRRAAQMALAPPTGPVFLSLPIDVQMADASGLGSGAGRLLEPRVRPPLSALQAAAECLATARNPAILVGSRVTEADAVAELVAVAERLGAAVFSEPGHSHGRLSFPADHPLYAQTIPLWAPEINRRLSEFDVLLVAGMDLLREYVYHGPEPAIPRGTADRAPGRQPVSDRQELSGRSRSPGRREMWAWRSSIDCWPAPCRRPSATPPRPGAKRAAQASRNSSQTARRDCRPARRAADDRQRADGKSGARPADQCGGGRRSGDHDQHARSNDWARCETPAATSGIAAGRWAGDWDARWV